MIAPLPHKLALPPFIASMAIVGDITSGLSAQVRIILDLAALSILFAGFLVVGRYKAALDASRVTADAWRDERDAALSRAERLEIEKRELEIQGKSCTESLEELRLRIASLESRPDFEALLAEIVSLRSMLTTGEGR
jgi:hypothetical protein